MIVVATFANRKYDPEVIELVCAWDEYSVDSNPKGWEEDRAKSLASWGDELLRAVDVEINVPMSQVEAALNPAVRIDATSVSIEGAGDE